MFDTMTVFLVYRVGYGLDGSDLLSGAADSVKSLLEDVIADLLVEDRKEPCNYDVYAATVKSNFFEILDDMNEQDLCINEIPKETIIDKKFVFRECLYTRYFDQKGGV